MTTIEHNNKNIYKTTRYKTFNKNIVLQYNNIHYITRITSLVKIIKQTKIKVSRKTLQHRSNPRISNYK